MADGSNGSYSLVHPTTEWGNEMAVNVWHRSLLPFLDYLRIKVDNGNAFLIKSSVEIYKCIRFLNRCSFLQLIHLDHVFNDLIPLTQGM